VNFSSLALPQFRRIWLSSCNGIFYSDFSSFVSLFYWLNFLRGTPRVNGSDLIGGGSWLKTHYQVSCARVTHNLTRLAVLSIFEDTWFVFAQSWWHFLFHTSPSCPKATYEGRWCQEGRRNKKNVTRWDSRWGGVGWCVTSNVLSAFSVETLVHYFNWLTVGVELSNVEYRWKGVFLETCCRSWQINASIVEVVDVI
jgi:hypothetical protein